MEFVRLNLTNNQFCLDGIASECDLWDYVQSSYMVHGRNVAVVPAGIA